MSTKHIELDKAGVEAAAQALWTGGATLRSASWSEVERNVQDYWRGQASKAVSAYLAALAKAGA
jgi:hypothetical protein